MKKLIIFGLMFILLAITVNGALIDNLVSYWNYDDSDVSGSLSLDAHSIYNLTIDGSTTGVSGMLNEAYDFDGTNDYTYYSNYPGASTGSISVSFWVYPESYIDHGGMVMYGISPAAGGQNYFTLKSRTASGGFIEMATRTAVGDYRYYNVSETSVLPVNNWYHYVVIWSGTQKEVWINGVNQSLAVIVTGGSETDYNNINDNQELKFGKYNDSSAYFTDGDLDEIGLWNRFINSTEIGWLHNSSNALAYPFTAGGGSPSSFVLNARSFHNNASLTNFNATINGTWYETTNGTINTNISENYLINITVESWGFENTTILNHNTSINPLMANMTQYPLMPQMNITYTSLVVGNTIDMNCTVNNTFNFDYSTYYVINNTIDSNVIRQTSDSYTILNTDTLDSLDISCDVNTTWRNETSSPDPIANNTIDMIVTFGAYSSYTGSLLTSVRFNFVNLSFNTTSNTYSTYITDFITIADRFLYTFINVTDLTIYHRENASYVNISESNATYNITLEPNELTLVFYNLGVLANTSGWVADELGRYANFTDSSYVIIQQNLSEGYVHIRFNPFVVLTNHTQFYEYINDFTNHVNEELELLQTANWYTYINVLDYSNSPLEDVIIRAYNVHWNYTSYTEYGLIGQRLTEDDGFTFLWNDIGSEMYINVYKEGYEPITKLLTIGDDSFTRDDPLIIYLKDSETAVVDNAWIYINNKIRNKSLDISGTLTAIGREKVEYTTQYRINNGLSMYDMSTFGSLDRYAIDLTSGSDYTDTTSDNITLLIYLDSVLWKNITIEYDSTTTTDLFPFSGLDNDTLNPALLIGLILLCLLMSVMIKGDGVATKTFKIGFIFLPLLSSVYIVILIIFGLSFIARSGIKKFFIE